MSLIIIVGLCGSGKSYYSKQFNNYKIYDDFISTFYNGNLLYDLEYKNKVCVIDPRLCKKDVFEKYIAIFQKYTDNISLILFENNLNSCAQNIIVRNDGRQGIIEINNYLTLQYDLNNYIGYDRVIVPCFR